MFRSGHVGGGYAAVIPVWVRGSVSPCPQAHLCCHFDACLIVLRAVKVLRAASS